MTLNNFLSKLLFVFILFSSCNGQAQTEQPKDADASQLTFTSKNLKLTKTQGSGEHQSVRCILQDKDGNLWFGTTGEGVYLYDGKFFTQFTVKDGLSSNMVWSLLEDSSGNIWFGTTEGLSRFDGKSIIPVSIDKNFISIVADNSYYTDWSRQNTVWSMLQDKEGTIWFGTGDGVYSYNGKNFSRFPGKDIINSENLHLKMVDDIIQDKQGNIWFASGMLPGNEGLCRFDGKSITRYKPGGDGWIRNVEEDKNGIIWSAGRHNGNWRFDGKSFSKYEKEGIGSIMLIDRAGNIWFDGGEKINTLESDGGIWRYDGTSFNNFSTRDGLTKFSVWSMLEDNSGNIWIGTRNCELYRFDGRSFKSFSE